jgi:hypothetical protein
MTRYYQKCFTRWFFCVSFVAAYMVLDYLIPWTNNVWQDQWTGAILPALGLASVLSFVLALWFTRKD